MPIYPFDCEACGYHGDVMKSISEYQEHEPCPQCGVEMQRDFAPRQPEDSVYQKPIEMFGVAPETPAELTDLRRKLPDVELTDQLVPVARTYAEKKRILKATGFEDRSGRGG